MSVEQGRTARILHEAQPKARGIQKYVGEIPRRIVRGFTENAAIAATVEYDPEYVDTFARAIADGFMPDFIGSHTAWFDAILMSYLTREAMGFANEHLNQEQQIKGVVMPFAKTMKTEKQGRVLNFMFQATLPTLTRNGIYPVYTATDNDQTQRDEAKNSAEFIADMNAMMREGFSAMAVLPEASVRGGKKGRNGKRIGMQLFRESTVASAYILAKKQRKPGVIFIPVGIENGWKVNNPHGKFPTIEGWKAGLLMTRDVCKMKVGKPIRSDDPQIAALIKERNWQELDNIMGFAVAQLISLDMRGVYTDSATLQQALEERKANQLHTHSS